MAVSTAGAIESRGRSTLASLVADRVLLSAHYCEQTESTNTDALNELRADEISNQELPRLILADRQTAGRGRHGRVWQAPKDALLMSVIIEKPSNLSVHLTSLAVGIAMARATEFLLAPIKTRLKWPNDLYVDGGKCAGILLEAVSSRLDCLVIGIGVNVNNVPEVQTPLSAPAQSLAQAAKRNLDRFELLDGIVREIVSTLADPPAKIIDDFRDRCLLTGQVISFVQQGNSGQGVCQGVADDGALLVQTESELQRCCSGEVSQVRVQPRQT